MWCVSTTLHRLSPFSPPPSPPSRCYPAVSCSVDLPRASHFLFKKQESCLLLFSLLCSDICWDRRNGGKGWGMREGWECTERRNYFWVILSWCYLKHFRVMRQYRVCVCVCVCVRMYVCVCLRDIKYRVVLNLRKSPLSFKAWDWCESLKFWLSCWGLSTLSNETRVSKILHAALRVKLCQPITHLLFFLQDLRHQWYDSVPFSNISAPENKY